MSEKHIGHQQKLEKLNTAVSVALSIQSSVQREIEKSDLIYSLSIGSLQYFLPSLSYIRQTKHRLCFYLYEHKFNI